MANRELWIGLGVAASLGIIVFGAFEAGLQVGRAQGASQVPQSKNVVAQVHQAPIIPANNDQQTGQASSTSDVVDATPEELLEYFRENSVGATDWVKGKKIRITYRLSGVSNNMFGGDRVAVAFKPESREIMAPTVQFWYEGSFRPQIGQFREGQSVTCVGTFNDAGFGGDLKFEGLEICAN